MPLALNLRRHATANSAPRIDSSRNEKRLVRVNSVMQGWTEGVRRGIHIWACIKSNGDESFRF